MPDRPRTGAAAILIIGVLYIVIGLVTAELAKHGGLAGTRAWRLIAWLTSGITYGTQIRHQRLRLRAPLPTPAVRARPASPVGALRLAVAPHGHPAPAPRGIRSPERQVDLRRLDGSRRLRRRHEHERALVPVLVDRRDLVVAAGGARARVDAGRVR